MSIVTLFVDTQEEKVSSERRFDKSLTISQLKYKLEPIAGVPYSTQKIQLYRKDELLCSLDDDDKMLGAYPVEDYMRILVIDTNPHRVKNQYTDVSLVEKFELSNEEYEKRSDTVRAFKERNKLGRFSDEAAAREDALEKSYQEAAKNIHVGDRCEVSTDPQAPQKRGTVKYIGTTKFQPGIWVGIQYDEPLGKNDGTVKGERYFECPPNYGGFVRPTKVTVGDFPEEDILLTDDELEEM
ncbi:CAP Gly-rich domain-containing protein [Mycotypha africana]|uniref:CAP Gly-rich domain-containing protein n=1 Tax=Mycotypha africana TaxID=64632 RepID=UPI00230014CD|nr:CAP Gly-rich domain-containing protein [Mycotypha africana]KAI8969211.1 CAP Gly-rich domain-containing protein [Mycotypha africana]